ncbi:MAG: aminotransferase class I/II-fold pyridoxal phosphate-dependent enzyme [Armatimonadetes bacterium]|nr:aminotransferase class I/II-fold pyridoxal phosphate-dependent enzyme [Armatimonadota bacterium]
MPESSPKRPGFATRAVHLASRMEGGLPGEPLNVPIVQTANFRFDRADVYAEVINERAEGWVYTRLGNPTVAAFESAIAELEGGERAVAFASGMAAISSAVIAHVQAGDHVVSSKAIYGGTHGLMSGYLPRWGVEVTYVDTNDLEAVRAAMRPGTKLLYTETIGNPTLRVPDIAALGDIAHAAGALMMIDNTFASPYLCRPLELGADVSIHSATKYISGHADTIAGVVIGSAEGMAPVTKTLHVIGGALAPLNAFLLLRGLKTLALRMERACATAQRIAEFLCEHPKIECVHYPGLSSHPDRDLVTRQLDGSGGMIAFEVAGGLEPAAKFQDSLKLIAIAASLGECHTLVSHPASTTHRQYSKADRKAAGITDGFVRLSVGLEDPEDLIADIAQAL